MDDQQAIKPPGSPESIQTVPDGVTIEHGYVKRELSARGMIEADDRRIFGRTVPPDVPALREACNRPENSSAMRLLYNGWEISDAPSWRELRVEIIYFPLIPDENGSITVPVRHPWVFNEFPGIDGQCLIARWLHRHPGKAGVLEVSWDNKLFWATPIKRSVHFLGAEGSGQDATRLLDLWVGGSDQKPPQVRNRSHRTRQSHLDQAVKAARYFMYHPDSPREPTEQDIADFIAAEEEIGCSRSTLTSRWRRLIEHGEEIITIAEVRQIARQ